MKRQWSHFLIQFLIFPSHVQHKKNEVCQIQSSIFVQYILIRSEITILLLQEMVISCKLCTNNSQSKCQNIKVLYKSASQVQWMQNIYMTEWFLSFVWCHSGFQLEQRAMGHCKATRGVLGHSPGEPGTEFSHHIPETDRNCVQSSWPQIQMDYLPHCVKICRDNKT